MPEKPRICLVYTGGTIGMVEEDGVLRPPDNPEDFLDMAPELRGFVDVDTCFPMNKDSTNMNPRDWERIAREIHKRRNDGYQGFVVAHGTDTMHFTASALAFAFGPNLNFPIVLTGAQTHPQVLHGDARINLIRACKVALEPLAEVSICFGDFVYRGCRAQKKDERRFDAFESPAFPPLAYITETIDIQPLAQLERPPEMAGEVNFRPHFSDGVLQVSLIPGLEPDILLESVLASGCKGVILQSFGAGNVPDRDAGEFSFEEFIGEVVGRGKPIIITSQFPAGSTLYSSYAPHQTAVNAGAIPTGNMTSAAAAVKFRWVLSLVEREIQSGVVPIGQRVQRIAKLMETKTVGELGPATVELADSVPNNVELRRVLR